MNEYHRDIQKDAHYGTPQDPLWVSIADLPSLAEDTAHLDNLYKDLSVSEIAEREAEILHAANFFEGEDHGLVFHSDNQDDDVKQFWKGFIEKFRNNKQR